MLITSCAAWRGPSDHLPATMAAVEITLDINSRELRTNRNLSRAAFVLGLVFYEKQKKGGKGQSQWTYRGVCSFRNSYLRYGMQ